MAEHYCGGGVGNLEVVVGVLDQVERDCCDGGVGDLGLLKSVKARIYSCNI